MICRKEGNKLCRLSGRMLLLASIPPPHTHIFSCFPHTLVSSLAPSLSLLLLRDSFGGTFAKWLDACLEYIFMFAKKAMRARAKLFEQGRAFAPFHLPPASACLPAPPTWFLAPFGCICTYCRCGILRLKFMGNCLPTNTESGILCFLKFNVTVFAKGGGRRRGSVGVFMCAVCCAYSTKYWHTYIRAHVALPVKGLKRSSLSPQCLIPSFSFLVQLQPFAKGLMLIARPLFGFSFD